jgi:hypothetical protein
MRVQQKIQITLASIMVAFNFIETLQTGDWRWLINLVISSFIWFICILWDGTT